MTKGIDRALIREELGALWRLALPLAAVQAGNKLKGLVDTAIVGRLGEAELAGVGLGNICFFTFMIFGIGVMMGFDPLIAQAIGASEPDKARRLMWQSVWLSVVLGLLMAAPVALLPSILAPMGIEEAVVAEAAIYMRIRAAGMVPGMMFFALRGYLQAVRHTRPLIVAMVVSNIINFFGTLLLVFGGGELPAWMGPLTLVPAWGVAGSAVVTVLTGVFDVAVLVWGIGRVPVERAPSRRPDLVMLIKACRVGGPLGFQYMAEVGIFTLVGFLAGRMGSLELAAHQVALMLASTSFTMAMGVASAGAVCVGRAVGSGDQTRVRVAGYGAVMMGTGIMGVSALVFWLFPGVLASALTDEARVIEAVIPLLAVAAVFQLSDGAQAVASGALRGAGDTRFSFLMNVAGHYTVGLPVAVALGFGLGWGISGLWWGLCAGLTVVAVGLLARFAKLTGRAIERI